MTVAVVGLWHLGCVTAACLAKAGCQVMGFDADENTIENLNNGIAPIIEPGLEALIQEQLTKGTLTFSTCTVDIQKAQIVWINFDTPVDEDDKADVSFVYKQVESLFPYLSAGTLVIVSSQLPVGSIRYLETKYQTQIPGRKVSFAYVPENLRLGKAIDVFTKPDRVIAGIRSEKDQERISALLAPFTDQIIWMSVESAEVTKHAINAFLATSVVFINELATICEKVGADAREVEQGLKSESRIGPKAYLRAGSAFSGGTLARDVAFLSKLSADYQLPLHLFDAVRHSNAAHKFWTTRKVQEVLGCLEGKKIAVWGLTYKPGTDTLRRSLAIELCHWLYCQGAHIFAFDPAVKILPKELESMIHLVSSPFKAAQGSDAIVVSTEWDDFREIRAAEMIIATPRPLVIDPGRFLEANLGHEPRIQYYSIGRGPLK